LFKYKPADVGVAVDGDDDEDDDVVVVDVVVVLGIPIASEC
jgi:hypothetical protein